MNRNVFVKNADVREVGTSLAPAALFQRQQQPSRPVA
jgi:hypothetical protein